MKYLVTGAAGFVSNFVSERLCDADHDVVGLDNFIFVKLDLADKG